MGGSLRNPANFCNVVALRTSPGRVPSWPVTLAWDPFVVAGPMARTVADCALFLSALAGPDRRAPISITESGEQFARPLDRDFRDVRIAWSSGFGLPFDPAVRSAVDGQRAVFESLGCIVETAEPDLRGADECFTTWRSWMFAAQLGHVLEPFRDQIKPTVQWQIEQGLALTGTQLARAEVLRTTLYHRVREFMDTYEFLVLPVNQVLPFPVDTEYPTEIDGVRMDTYIDWMRSAYYISTIGNPAISVPCAFSPDGLPIGIQIVGRHRDDWGVLQLAYAFEQVTQIGQRRPPLATAC
jgi:amidase